MDISELKKIIKLSNKKENLEFALNVTSTAHATNRWYGREGCDGTLLKTPTSELATFIEKNKKVQESLCVLYADGDYNVLVKKGYTIGFQHNNIAYVTKLKEDEILIVTVHNLVTMRREFDMRPGDYYFDSEFNLRVS